MLFRNYCLQLLSMFIKYCPLQCFIFIPFISVLYKQTLYSKYSNSLVYKLESLEIRLRTSNKHSLFRLMFG